MGTFKIIENQSDSVKFRGMVVFNDKPAQYYEVDLDVIDREIEAINKEKEDKTDEQVVVLDQQIAELENSQSSRSAYINAQLQKAADQDAIVITPFIPAEIDNEGNLI